MEEDRETSSDHLAAKERMISESPVMWPEPPFCKQLMLMKSGQSIDLLVLTLQLLQVHLLIP